MGVGVAKVGTRIQILSPEFAIQHLRLPIDRSAVYPQIRTMEGRVIATPSDRAQKRFGLAFSFEARAFAPSKDLSIVEWAGGSFVGLCKYVTPGRGQVLPLTFVRDTDARRVIETRGNILAGWLGASAVSVEDFPATTTPHGTGEGAVLI